MAGYTAGTCEYYYIPCMTELFLFSYQSYIRLYFEVYTGVKVKWKLSNIFVTMVKQFVFHGFEPKEAENALCIMNHQCTTDWFVFDILGSAANAVGRVRFVLKVIN